MKYLEKSFNSGANSKLYRENFDSVFGESKDKKGYVDIELDLDEDMIVFLEKYAKDNNITFNDACIEILKSQLDYWDDEKNLKEFLNELADQDISDVKE